MKTRNLTIETLTGRQLMAVDVGNYQQSVEIDPAEQLMLELINRARQNPAAEAHRLGIELNRDLAANTISNNPKQPLALNEALSRAAEMHSLDMLTKNYFSHTSLDGRSPSDRVEAVGYPHGVAENLAIYPTLSDLPTATQASHDLLFNSAGHRQNMLRDHAQEIGLGVQFGEYDFDNQIDYPTLMTTQKYGFSAVDAAITGVAYEDSVLDDDFYTVGEGIADLSIEALADNSQVYVTKTNSAGGYSLHVPPGSYHLRALNAEGNVLSLGRVTVGNENVKVDAVDSKFDKRHTALSRLDTNRDGLVSPLDALLVINLINSSGTYSEQLDVSEDGHVSLLDVLLVVNHLNARNTGSGESFPIDGLSSETLSTTDLHLLDEQILMAQQDLSLHLGVPVSKVQFESAWRVIWKDTALETGVLAGQALTPGLRIILRVDSEFFEYRTSGNGLLILVQNGN